MAKADSNQQLNNDLNKPVEAKKDKKFVLTIAGKKKTVKVDGSDTELTIADRMAIIQAYEDEKSGENLKKGYKKPKKADYREQATLMALEYTDVNRSGSN